MATIIRTPPLGWTLRFALLRIGAGWRALLAILAGVLLTTIIGAAVPLYTATVAQFGMTQRLAQSPPENVHLFSRTTVAAVDVENFPDLWEHLDTDVRAAAHIDIQEEWGAWLDGVAAYSESSPMFVVRDGADVAGLKLRAAYYQNLADHVTVVEGEFLSEDLPLSPLLRSDIAEPGTVDPNAGLGIPILITQSLAEQYGFAVGDVVRLDQRGWDTSLPFDAQVVGIIEAADPDDPFFAAPSPLRFDPVRGGEEANVFTTQHFASYIATDLVPQTRNSLGWRTFLDHDELPAQRIPAAVVSLNRFKTNLDTRFEETYSQSHLYETELPGILTAYNAEVGALAAPFGVLLLQVGGLALFFLVITAALVQRSDRREVAMLQSRGALDGQVLFLRGAEAVLIAGAAAIAAPFIARQLLVWLSPLFTDSGVLPLILDANPFIYAGIAALFAALALLFTLRPILRMPLITAGGGAARAEKQVWWQRYYLDIALLVIGSAALFRLLDRESPFARSIFGGLRADPLLLIAPALLFISLGSVTLRLFPPLTEAAARILAARRDAPAAIGAWQVSREPAHYARIAFLLALAIGVGWFATSFGATLARSQEDQAAYAIGADVRLTEHDSALGIDRVLAPESYAALDGVESASVALRIDDINLAQNDTSLMNGTVLAVDLATIRDTAYWRDDMGALPLPTPIDMATSGVVLEGTPATISMTIRLDTIQLDPTNGQAINERPEIAAAVENITYSVRLRDGNNAFYDVPMTVAQIEGVEDISDLSAYRFQSNPFAPQEMQEAEAARLAAALEGVSGWMTLQGAVPEGLPAPVRFEAIHWVSGYDEAFVSGAAQLRLTTSSLMFFDTAGSPLPTDAFQTPDGWTMVNENNAIPNAFYTIIPTERGNGAMTFWNNPNFNQDASLGLALNVGSVAVPSVVSRNFADQYFLVEGATFDLFIERRRVTFVVTGFADYFPTVYGDRKPFVIADLDALLESFNSRPGDPIHPREVWLNLEPGVSPDEWITARSENGSDQVVTSALTRDSELERLRGDALSLGLSRLLFLAFAVALILSAVSLLAYAALSAQSRKAQFAVLRALGMSSARITRSVLLEQGLVIGAGVLLGAVMGLLLSSQVLPALAITSDGSPLTPPFLVQVETNALTGYGALLALLLVGVMLATGVIIRRQSLGQALRYGEE